jgi:hypothetical protein
MFFSLFTYEIRFDLVLAREAWSLALLLLLLLRQ